MRWIKILILTVATLFGLYSLAMYYFAEESKVFSIEKTVDYPVDKVFSQFNNLQNLSRWNNYFSSSKTMTVDFYKPYEGLGSAMSFYDKSNDRTGEMSIKYVNPLRSLKYQLFEGDDENPSTITVKFKALNPEQTKITWLVHSPKMPLLKRSVNFWTEDVFVDNVEKSMANLKNLMSNKIEKDLLFTNIKYDSIMVEQEEGSLLLGVNISTSNKKGNLYKNVVMSYNKVFNYATNDLGKSEDEVGFPVLVTTPNNYKDKEVSYYLGIPLSKRLGVVDNNFNFRTMNGGKTYVIFYKGNYENRVASIQKLLQKAKKDTMRNGDLQQVFIERPENDKEVNLKLMLPVYR